MAYPPVIPPLTKNEGREFVQRLQDFKLSPEQKSFWANPDKTTVEQHQSKKGK